MVDKFGILGLIVGVVVVLIAVSVMGNNASESLPVKPVKITTIINELPVAESFDKDYILISYDEIPK